jgi:Putative transposase
MGLPLHPLGLEQLARYVLRLPIAQDRLIRTADGRVLLTLKAEWSDGTMALLFERVELLERLAGLTPPPRREALLAAAWPMVQVATLTGLDLAIQFGLRWADHVNFEARHPRLAPQGPAPGAEALLRADE